METTFWRIFTVTFATVFLAEIGDKTQLLTMKLQVTHKARVAVFAGAALALAVTSLLAVLFGDVLHRILPEEAINDLFGMFFVTIGVLMWLGRF